MAAAAENTALQELFYQGAVCQECGGTLHADRGHAVVAQVLDVPGWKDCLHVPFRCRRGACRLSGKRVWHNFVSEAHDVHSWCWPDGKELKHFFITTSWGVSTAWLRQHTQRLTLQFASFVSEAEVHDAELERASADRRAPHRADLKLKQAWLMWRLVAASILASISRETCHMQTAREEA
jgi:hypothetical protein